MLISFIEHGTIHVCYKECNTVHILSIGCLCFYLIKLCKFLAPVLLAGEAAHELHPVSGPVHVYCRCTCVRWCVCRVYKPGIKITPGTSDQTDRLDTTVDRPPTSVIRQLLTWLHMVNTCMMGHFRLLNNFPPRPILARHFISVRTIPS